jgi:hypothetical protein
VVTWLQPPVQRTFLSLEGQKNRVFTTKPAKKLTSEREREREMPAEKAAGLGMGPGTVVDGAQEVFQKGDTGGKSHRSEHGQGWKARSKQWWRAQGSWKKAKGLTAGYEEKATSSERATNWKS